MDDVLLVIDSLDRHLEFLILHGAPLAAVGSRLPTAAKRARKLVNQVRAVEYFEMLATLHLFLESIFGRLSIDNFLWIIKS